jgi:hypothetical protein
VSRAVGAELERRGRKVGRRELYQQVLELAATVSAAEESADVDDGIDEDESVDAREGAGAGESADDPAAT